MTYSADMIAMVQDWIDEQDTIALPWAPEDRAEFARWRTIELLDKIAQQQERESKVAA